MLYPTELRALSIPFIPARRISATRLSVCRHSSGAFSGIVPRAAGFSPRGCAHRAAGGTCPPMAEPARISSAGRHSPAARNGTPKTGYALVYSRFGHSVAAALCGTHRKPRHRGAISSNSVLHGNRQRSNNGNPEPCKTLAKSLRLEMVREVHPT